MFGRGRRRHRTAPTIADEIRRSISRLDEQRRLAAEAAGRALVNQAEVTRVCHEQLRILADAVVVAADGETLARRAADGARRDATDSAADLVAYDRTAAGLHTVQDALGAAAEPIHRLLADAGDNVEQARRVLGRSRAMLDEQIREQVRLLSALEGAERARIVTEARHRPAGPT